MNTSLARIEPQDRSLTLTQMCDYADIFIESGIFKDATSQAQAVVKIMAGQELGLEPFAAMSELHIIDGKVTQSAGLLAKKIKQSGAYDYNISEHTDQICTITISRNGEVIGVESLTIAEATKRGLTQEWNSKAQQWRDKQNWKKHPKNMLFARVISNAVRFFCPEITGGIVAYTHDEFDPASDDAPEIDMPAPKMKKIKGAIEASNEVVVVPAPPPVQIIPKAETDAALTKRAQELSAEFRAELKDRENKELAAQRTQADSQSELNMIVDRKNREEVEAKIAAAKRTASAWFKKKSVTTPDQQLIWSELGGNLDEVERFLEIFPGKVPIVISAKEILEVWRAENGNAETVLPILKDRAAKVFGHVEPEPEPVKIEPPPALPNGFVEACQNYEIPLPERSVIWKAFGNIEDAEDFLMFRTSKDVPPDFPLDNLIEIWKDTDGHLRKAKQAVIAMETAASEIVKVIAHGAPGQSVNLLPSTITPAKRSLKDDPVGFDVTPFWKWVKSSGLDETAANRARIFQIIELNSENRTVKGKTETRVNWEAVIHQVKTEFSA